MYSDGDGWTEISDIRWNGHSDGSVARIHDERRSCLLHPRRFLPPDCCHGAHRLLRSSRLVSCYKDPYQPTLKDQKYWRFVSCRFIYLVIYYTTYTNNKNSKNSVAVGTRKTHFISGRQVASDAGRIVPCLPALGPKSKFHQGGMMQNIVNSMCEKFHYDRLKNDRALGNGKSDNNKNNNNNNVRSAWRPVSGLKMNEYKQQAVVA